MQFNRGPDSVAVTNTVSVLQTDDFAVIYDGTFIWPAGDSGVIDVSAYQSVIINITEIGPAGDFPRSSNYHVAWFNANSLFNNTGIDQCIIRTSATDQGGYLHRLTLPCKGSRLIVSNPDANPDPANLIASVVVMGSYRQLGPRYERQSVTEWGVSGFGTTSGEEGSRFVSWTLNLAAGAAVTADEYPPQVSGPATLTLDVASITGAPSFSLQDASSGANFAGVTRVAPVQGITEQSIMIPRRPIRMHVAITAAQAINARMSLIYTEQSP